MPAMRNQPRQCGRTSVGTGRAGLGPVRPVGRYAAVSLAVLLSYGPCLRVNWSEPHRRLSAVWAQGPNLAAKGAGPVPPKPLPRGKNTIVQHASRSVAATVVLVEQSCRVNLSRLGGLQGP
jgi:hypothetical protein